MLPTWGFVQAGVAVQTSAVCIAVLGLGWTEFCWAFSCYLVLLFLYWASVPGWTINNALPAQSPFRCRQGVTNTNTLKKYDL